jgi:Tfp pilus assembly protein PilV
MRTFFRKNNQKGFLSVEIMIAVSIIVVVILVALSVAEKSIKVSRLNLRSVQAAFLLEEGAEATHLLRDNAWTNISSLSPAATYYPFFSGGTWVLSGTPTQIGIFTRTVTIVNVNRDNITNDIAVSGIDDPGTKLVTVTVFWNDGETTITRTLQFYISDIFS